MRSEHDGSLPLHFCASLGNVPVAHMILQKVRSLNDLLHYTIDSMMIVPISIKEHYYYEYYTLRSIALLSFASFYVLAHP